MPKLIFARDLQSQNASDSIVSRHSTSRFIVFKWGQLANAHTVIIFKELGKVTFSRFGQLDQAPPDIEVTPSLKTISLTFGKIDFGNDFASIPRLNITFSTLMHFVLKNRAWSNEARLSGNSTTPSREEQPLKAKPSIETSPSLKRMLLSDEQSLKAL